MSFWSDASGTTKGIIVAGVLAILLGVVYLLWPEGERAQSRGVHAGDGVPASTH
jgi:ABC-type thiamin/hydroxymethylpyrimidine transport system permease subunit